MTLQEFEECLERFGSDLARWPEAERAKASKLLAESSLAEDSLAQAVAITSVLLEAEAAIEPSAGLRRRVNEIPLRYPRPAAEAPGAAVLRAWAWLTLACALGVAGGVWAGTYEPGLFFESASAESEAFDEGIEELMLASSFDGSSTDWSSTEWEAEP